MYVPAFTAVEEHEARGIVADIASGWLVTASDEGLPEATLMPIVWDGDRLIAHMAKANAHWRHIVDDTPALVIVTGPEAYISPSWYASKAEHGKVVPTWNYLAVHLLGAVRIHHEPAWLLRAVTQLTDTHETSRRERWRVTDAPDEYISAQLKAIVGVEMRIDSFEAKVKLGQNRSEADRRGVIEGLGREPDSRSGSAIADEMRSGLEAAATRDA